MKKKQTPIATPQEVEAFFTSMMRGEITEEAVQKVGGTEERIQVPPRIGERCKAAELMGKHYGLFDRKEESQPQGPVTQEILQMLARMHASAAEGSH